MKKEKKMDEKRKPLVSSDQNLSKEVKKMWWGTEPDEWETEEDNKLHNQLIEIFETEYIPFMMLSEEVQEELAHGESENSIIDEIWKEFPEWCRNYIEDQKEFGVAE
jgi:hypothetical protein